MSDPCFWQYPVSNMWNFRKISIRPSSHSGSYCYIYTCDYLFNHLKLIDVVFIDDILLATRYTSLIHGFTLTPHDFIMIHIISSLIRVY